LNAAPRPVIRVQTADFDVGVELSRIRLSSPRTGALASFVGVVRDVNENVDVGGMFLEHYPGMTERAIEEIVEVAQQRWDIHDVTVIHRVGDLVPTDQIVLVAVGSSHRREAFAACEFVMDFLKTRAPFWKRESGKTGARWVRARTSDDDAARRWDSEEEAT
jgi:molybdopterin synthase catalytic subunit